MSMRTVSFRAWRDAASLLAMGRQRVQAMDAEETGAQQITDVVSESVGQGRAQQRAFYENLVTNCGITDQELQHHVSLIRAQLAEFNSAYRDQPFVVPGAPLTAADVAIWVDVERLLATQVASGSGLDVGAEFPHLYAAYLRLADAISHGAAAVAAPSAKQPGITAFTADLSLCSQIARLAIAEHGLSCKNVHVDIECRMDNYDPWYIELNPKMTVPTMRYGDVVVGDSKDILYYLAERHPGLYPPELRPAIDAYIDGFYQQFRAIAAFTFGHLVQQRGAAEPGAAVVEFIRRGKLTLTRQKLRWAAATQPELASVCEAKLAEKLRFDMVEWARSQDCAALTQQMGSFLAQMERGLAERTAADDEGAAALPHEGGCLLGERYTLADIVGTVFCARVHLIKGTELFGELVAQYWAAMQRRDSWTQAHCIGLWEESLMAKQIAAEAAGGDPMALDVEWAEPR